MRFFSFLILVVVVGAVAVFALQNQQEITLKFWDAGVTSTVAVVTATVYVLGMITGWSVIGLVRRSLSKVTEQTARK